MFYFLMFIEELRYLKGDLDIFFKKNAYFSKNTLFPIFYLENNQNRFNKERDILQI